MVVVNQNTKRLDLHFDALPSATQKALKLFSNFSWLKRSRWYLAGDTALALQVGHRQSVDLDFFTSASRFAELELERKLFATGQWKTTLRQAGTIYGELLGAKVSFIAYPFFQTSRKRLLYNYVQMLLVQDIAAMKIIAISQRGRKRDFVDLYWLCQNFSSLDQIVTHALNSYPGQSDNLHHIIKSLVYFDDAEFDPMPKLFFEITWNKIEKFFVREVTKLNQQFYL